MFGEIVAVFAVFVVFAFVATLLGVYVWLVDRSQVARSMRMLRERWEGRYHPRATLAVPEFRRPHRDGPMRLPRGTAAPEFTTPVATAPTPAQRFAAYTAWTTGKAERTQPDD